MTNLSQTICCLGCVTLFILYFCESSNAADRPNIVYILADDMGYGDLGCMGQEKIRTPYLDRMAAEGLLFSRHYAGSPVCGPSRACLMTGMSQTIGYIKGNPGGDWRKENLRDQDITVAEKLKEAGYETVCIGKWGLGPQGKSGYPTNQGFDHFVGYDTHRSAHNYYPRQVCQDNSTLLLGSGEYSHDVFTRLAFEYLNETKIQPFFLYLCYTIPHGPYNPPDQGPYADEDWPEQFKNYAAMITRMDRDIGSLFEVLKANGIAEDTLVIFSSDNGPQSSYGTGPNAMTEFFDSNGQLRGIKRDVLEGGVRVPMIAWWPGTIAPGHSDHISGFQDIMPTFCELAGVSPPPGIDGVSMLPTLYGEDHAQVQHDYLYWEFIRMEENRTSGARQAVLDVSENVKGIRYGTEDSLAVYQLDKDLAESEDVCRSRPELTAALEKYMDESRTESKLWPRTMLKKGWKPERTTVKR